MPRRKKVWNKDNHAGKKWEGDHERQYGENGKRIDDRPPGSERRGWPAIDRNNQQLFDFYKGLAVVPPNEWDDFVSALKKPLPTSFRVTGIRSQAKELVKMMKNKYFSHLADATVDGKKVDPPTEIPWYPDGLAWQVNLDRSTIRKQPQLYKFHKLLIAETESGNISRQEAVSMIPPLLLDIKPHHKILDMCAAPGSKTAQLIELLHSDESILLPEGFVIANDVDNKRCYLMVHQIKRIESPCFMVINHDAASFPRIDSCVAGKALKFDRVLADVPCSGDGTIRKNADIWKKWHPLMACNLHNIQKQILKRGIQLLECGGKIVYSTCSMNPVEDEAVIASILQTNDDIELLDVSQQLPELKSVPGLKSWKLCSREGVWMSSVEEVPEKLKTVCLPSMFPPSPEVADQLNLNRCVRVLPHQQDTGGFFIAVLQKKGTPPTKVVKTVEEATVTLDTKDGLTPVESDNDKGVKRERSRSPTSRNQKRMKGYSEDKSYYMEADNTDVWPEIKKFFEINEDFPFTQLLYRGNTGRKRNLYFTSNQIKNIMINNPRLRFINLGLRMFTRNENVHVKCGFRIAQEGVQQLKPYFDRRIIQIPFEDLIILLGIEENPFLKTLTEETQDELSDVDPGCVVFKYKADLNRPDTPQCRIDLCGWLGTKSARTFVDKHERQHYLRLCGQDVEEMIRLQEIKDVEKKAAAATAAVPCDTPETTADDDDETVTETDAVSTMTTDETVT